MIILTPEEETILRPEYEEYLAWFKQWMIPEAIPDSFDYWWRAMADEAKNRAKYE